MEGKRRLIAVLTFMIFIAITLAPMQSHAARGWLLGAGIGFAKTSSHQENVTDQNGGFASYLDVGYGFSEYFTAGAYIGGDVAQTVSGSGVDNILILPFPFPYIGAYGRFTYDAGKNLEPYANIGLGAYATDVVTLGLKAGGGLNWFPGKNSGWFLGPELAFHYVPKDDDSAFEGMLKFGYQWKKQAHSEIQTKYGKLKM